MSHKDRIHGLIKEISEELYQYISEQETSYDDRWVPTANIKRDLELNFVAVPRLNVQYGPKGWLFAIIARMLEDQNLIEYKKSGHQAYCRTIGDSGASLRTRKSKKGYARS